MTDEDFYNYYAKPTRYVRYQEGWDTYIIFPTEASQTLEGERKALNALYRFAKSGLVEFYPQNSFLETLKELEEAPLDLPNEPVSAFIETWMMTLVQGTDSFIETEASRLGIPLDSDEPFSPDYRKNLTAYFQKHGVGFEKGNVYPPK